MGFVGAIAAAGLVVDQAVGENVAHEAQLDSGSGNGVPAGTEVGSFEAHATEGFSGAEDGLGVDLLTAPGGCLPGGRCHGGDVEFLVMSVGVSPTHAPGFQGLRPFGGREEGVSGRAFFVITWDLGVCPAEEGKHAG